MDCSVNVISVEEPGRQLRISARAPEVDHQLSGNLQSKLRSFVEGDDMKRKINAGSCTRTCEHIAVAHEYTVVQHADFREVTCEAICKRVMGSASPTSQKSRFSRQECAGANGAEALNTC